MFIKGWTSNNMIRSRTFTRELNDPKAENDLIVEEFVDHEPKKKKDVKRFKLNTTEIESEASLLMSRTEELLHSHYNKKIPGICKSEKSLIPSANSEFPDVGDTLKLRTESLLHSKTRKKKKKTKIECENNHESSWSNIPRCFNVTTSMLSSDAGISSMPSSMISNVSESENEKKSKNEKVYQQVYEPAPDVLEPQLDCKVSFEK